MTTIRRTLKEGDGRKKQIESHKVLAAQTIIFDSDKCTRPTLRPYKQWTYVLKLPIPFIYFVSVHNVLGDTRWRTWIRQCATSWKVADSIPGCVIVIFPWHNPCSCIMALWLTKPLTKMSTRNISWGGKSGRSLGLTTLPPSCADCLEIWEPQPPGTLRACPGL